MEESSFHHEWALECRLDFCSWVQPLSIDAKRMEHIDDHGSRVMQETCGILNQDLPLGMCDMLNGQTSICKVMVSMELHIV